MYALGHDDGIAATARSLFDPIIDGRKLMSDRCSTNDGELIRVNKITPMSVAVPVAGLVFLVVLMTVTVTVGLEIAFDLLFEAFERRFGA